MSTSEGKCVLLEVGALISWCIYSYRIVMLLVPYMWASMTFLPKALKYVCNQSAEELFFFYTYILFIYHKKKDTTRYTTNTCLEKKEQAKYRITSKAGMEN